MEGREKGEEKGEEVVRKDRENGVMKLGIEGATGDKSRGWRKGGQKMRENLKSSNCNIVHYLHRRD